MNFREKPILGIERNRCSPCHHYLSGKSSSLFRKVPSIASISQARLRNNHYLSAFPGNSKMRFHQLNSTISLQIEEVYSARL